MFHSVMTGSDTINSYFEHKLNYYASKMPAGKFINIHNDKTEYCPGIAVLASGEVVALFKELCCLNSIYTDRNDKVHLRTSSVGGNFHWVYPNWKVAVDNCNNSLSYGKFAIIAYYIFDEYEDKELVSMKKSSDDSFDQLFEEVIEKGMKELEKTRKTFMKNHAKRMDLLD